MNTLASGLSYIDLHFRGRPRIIATAVVRGPDGVALIDPGPTSTLPALRAGLAEAGLSLRDVRALLLTHIHLDHAGATGTIVREHPELRVYVHERGAPHMIDPSKLLASATRLYGDMMDQLWGEVAAVPAESIDVLRGGERISAGSRDFDVAYTPGHASHHVSYRVRWRHGWRPPESGRIQSAADSSARHRSRAVEREPRADRALERGNSVHHALRSASTRGATPYRDGRSSPVGRGPCEDLART
jgi:ribonuclease BN (tRNA processing enzyme)